MGWGRSHASGTSATIARRSGSVTSGASRAWAASSDDAIRQQDVVGDRVERPSGVLGRIAPGVVDEQRRAVVDEVQPTMPGEDVRVAGRSVGVRDEGVEPDDVGGEVGVRPAVGPRVERQRARQEVETGVDARASLEQLADPWIAVQPAERRVDVDEDELRHGQAQRPRQLARDDLRDERPRTLRGAVELDDVQAVVVCLDEPGQRAALAERRDVLRRTNAADLRGRHGSEA